MKITQYLLVGLLAASTKETFTQTVEEVAGNGIFSRPHINRFPYCRLGLEPSAHGKGARPQVQTVRSKNGCPEGFLSFQDSCFSQSVIPHTWYSAQLVCQRAGHGGDLASINSKEEFNFVQRKFRDGSNELSWIGLYKEDPGTPYKWVNGDTVRYLPWASGYTGQERTGYVAINLTNPSFLPKTNPNELLPFLCETRNALSSSTAAAAVDAVQPVRGEARAQDEEITREKDDTREDTAEILNTCTECWKSFERKCYKAFKEEKSYKDAIATCKKEAANLIFVNSRESEFVRQPIMLEGRPGEIYWFGLSRSGRGLKKLIISPPLRKSTTTPHTTTVYTTLPTSTIQPGESQKYPLRAEKPQKHESAPAYIEPEDDAIDRNQNTITIGIAVIGCVVFIAAIMIAISWRRHFGNSHSSGHHCMIHLHMKG
ncbi:hypothetical protein RRG08_058160 [Elysia crispata]|uniref:C-type lectin domain-containing protein n=1 Tax=Elysia crispata TaxID=231223 RepID=A0AAE0Y206_9GAST|nr:hypothetical protein RRG08_058160 [Elysia crispata]